MGSNFYGFFNSYVSPLTTGIPPNVAPNARGVCLFDGEKISRFVSFYETYATDKGFTSEEFVKKFGFYCVDYLRQRVNKLAYDEELGEEGAAVTRTLVDWETFKDRLLKAFKKRDLKFSWRDFKNLGSEKLDFNSYVDRFQQMLQNIEDTDETRVLDRVVPLFLNGLDTKIQEKFVKKDGDNLDAMLIDEVIAKAEGYAEDLEKIEKTRKNIAMDLKDQYGETGELVINENASVDELSEALNKLTLLVKRKHGDGNAGKRVAEKVFLCIYCDKENCSKRQCAEFAKDKESGLCAEKEGKIVYSDGDFVPVNFTRGGMMKLVREKARNFNTNFITVDAPVQYPVNRYTRMKVIDEEDIDYESDVSEVCEVDVAAEKRDRDETAPMGSKKQKIVKLDLGQGKIDKDNKDKKKSKLSSDIQERSPDPKLIVERILSNKLEMNVGELLSLSLPVRKQFEEVTRRKRIEVNEIGKDEKILLKTQG